MKRSLKLMGCAVASAMALTAGGAQAASPYAQFHHIVVIYEENHSFDNLYGKWGSVEGEPVNGLTAAPKAKTLQKRQDGTTYACLKQLDVNLTSPPLPATCTDNGGPTPISSNFPNAPFPIEAYIASTDTTCPPPGVFATNGIPKGSGQPGGCTRDIFHRYYSEQYQIDGGKQDHYVTGSDASGTAMGYYDTTHLPIYTYLHSAGAPHYIVADNFYQGAFGGSFLNHQWLVSAAAPVFAGALNDGSSNDLHSVVDANGMATSTPLYTTPLGAQAKDMQLTASCSPPAGRPATPAGVTCGDYAVNTTQPWYQPYSPGTAAAKRLAPLTNATIGDRLTAAGVNWAWYSGGWSNADGDVGAPGWTNGSNPAAGCTDSDVLATATYPNCPDKNFQFHHQAFNYYASYAPGTPARAQHLRDEAEFIQKAQSGKLLPVSFIKPIGTENEHPGYASETVGSSHLVDLLNAIFQGPEGADTLVIVTYDEFGGQWDHSSPPSATNRSGSPHDQWGPGTRIPALILSPAFTHSTVDHAEHDTTSILTTLETRFHLAPLGTRDAAVSNLFGSAFRTALGL